MADVRWTTKEAAEHWGVTPTLVNKWIRQNRIKFEALGGTVRTHAYVVLTDQRPPRAAHGELTPEQRAVWPRGGAAPKKPEPKRRRRRVRK